MQSKLRREMKSVIQIISLGLFLPLLEASRDINMKSKKKKKNEGIYAATNRPVQNVGHNFAANSSLLAEPRRECPHNSL